MKKLSLFVVLFFGIVFTAGCANREKDISSTVKKGETGAVKVRTLSSRDAASLLIAPQDLPWQVVLRGLAKDASVTTFRFEDLAGKCARQETWLGPPTSIGGSRKTAHYSIGITFALADTPEQAANAAWKYVHSHAVTAPEITGKESVAKFADRAWYSSNPNPDGSIGIAGLTFVRGNVAALVHMSHKDGFPEHQIFDLAACIGRKIDAALSGHPEPAPVLPPSVVEMKLSLQEAWDAKHIDKMLGKKG